MRGESCRKYNPDWLVELSKKCLPYLKSLPYFSEEGLDFLPDALASCTSCIPESHCYIHFVKDDKPNQEGSSWRYITSVELYDKKLGIILVDLLLDISSENPYEDDPIIGGIEYFDHLGILTPVQAERHFHARLSERFC
tara:strand:+ start:289 stop:705 length:417 start_codon:yes stop_codon:yes gene_type:complete